MFLLLKFRTKCINHFQGTRKIQALTGYYPVK